MEFHAALKKVMGCMGIWDMKTKHSKSIENYVVGILSIHRELFGGILLFPCPLDMPNVLYLPFLLCCLTDAFNLNWFLPCSAILAYQLWKLQLYVVLNWSCGLINTHRPLVTLVNLRPVNCARSSESGRLYCKW